MIKPLIRFCIGFFVVCILLMTWWSSYEIETDLKRLHEQLRLLKKQTETLSSRLRQAYHHPLNMQHTAVRSHLSDVFANLLTEDLYFKIQLPKALGAHFIPTGIRKEATLGRPANLHPFNGYRDVSTYHSMCTPSLAQLHVGKFETLAPDLAIKIEERPREDLPGATEYWVHLRDGLLWHPLNPSHFPANVQLDAHFLKSHPVTANDFKFCYEAIMNPYLSEPKAASLRTYLKDIEELKVIDDLTFVVRWKAFPKDDGTYQVKYASLSVTGFLQPLPCFLFQYFADGTKIIEDEGILERYRTDSIWAQNFSQHWAKNTIASCGPYLFDGMNEEGIFFKRNPDYHNPYAVLVERYHISFKESFDAVWQEFKAGHLDVCHISPNQLAEFELFLNSADYQQQVAKGMQIHSIDYIDRCFYYLGWNLQKPLFQSQKIRQALTQAIDRRRIIEQNLNQMAISITGPFFPYSTAYDATISAWPYNPDLACRLLEEEGWVDLDGDGIREKVIDGRPISFKFRLYYYVKSLSTKVIMDYIATALRDIGVDCQPYGLDITDLSKQFDEKSFDAIFMGWKLGAPPDDPRQIWHSAGAKEKGSSNAIGFINAQIDDLIDKLSYEPAIDKRVHYYHSFHQIIHQQLPYTFLYTPKVRMLYRDRVQNLFIPHERQDLIPGADIPEPHLQTIWLKSHPSSTL